MIAAEVSLAFGRTQAAARAIVPSASYEHRWAKSGFLGKISLKVSSIFSQLDIRTKKAD